MREADNKCQVCRYYDECNSKEDSNTCKRYEYYKCTNCIDKLVEHDEIPRCFRGGTPIMDIKYCDKDRTKPM